MEANAPELKQTLTEHLANERTMLAYVRTAVSLVGFGITINRFGAFVRQIAKEPKHTPPAWLRFVHDVDRVGLGMVLLGLALLGWASVHFNTISKAIDRGDYRPHRASVLVLAGAVFLFGLLSVVSLFTWYR